MRVILAAAVLVLMSAPARATDLSTLKGAEKAAAHFGVPDPIPATQKTKGLCLCWADPNAPAWVGYLWQVETHPSAGEVQVALQCLIPRFDEATGAFKTNVSCGTVSGTRWEVLK